MILSKVTSRPMFKATYLKTRKISNIQTKMHLWLNLAHLNLMQQQHSKLSSLVLLAAQPGQLVGNNNIKLGCSLHNLFPLPGGHIVCNLSTVSPVVHHQQFKLLSIVHNKFLETIRKIMAGLLVWPITNVGHQSASLELSTDSRINTLGSAPVCLPCINTFKQIQD